MTQAPSTNRASRPPADRRRSIKLRRGPTHPSTHKTRSFQSKGRPITGKRDVERGEIAVTFREPPKCILDYTTDKSRPGGIWLPGSVLNIAECCLLSSSHLRKEDDSCAIVWRDEGDDDSDVNRWWRMHCREVSEREISAYRFTPAYLPIDSAINILFSSGTTGEPKAIPWTQLSPIRCSFEALIHNDVGVGDVYCWPTNLGWVMGPILLFSCFLTGATLVLYHGSPLGRGFGKFVHDAGVTVLGTVPSLLKTWKNTNIMLHHGSPLQPQAFGAFSTASMITNVVILDEHGVPYPDDKACVGEVDLLPHYLEATDRLLNADHEDVYFKGMPTFKGMEAWGYPQENGRRLSCCPRKSDDTMNLGGIKTSSVEIKRVCDSADESISETAAVSVAPPMVVWNCW
ncbi:putative acyl-activating enzyme 18, peroxisomal [Hibiscus syriacus]|uniref:Acyl-activating enzyme 18, peroxisomal n=1 Tax=Hibiscus syriacus TaxID=106335 RepID=A0A6A3B8Q7_HIBSY|nr:putative acyl-activating enzyme 18, peroxisomal [Hibiscus syriacus]